MVGILSPRGFSLILNENIPREIHPHSRRDHQTPPGILKKLEFQKFQEFGVFFPGKGAQIWGCWDVEGSPGKAGMGKVGKASQIIQGHGQGWEFQRIPWELPAMVNSLFSHFIPEPGSREFQCHPPHTHPNFHGILIPNFVGYSSQIPPHPHQNSMESSS